MSNQNLYKLPKLPYQYSALEPYISSEQLRAHYEKHHNSYVEKANALMESLSLAREKDIDISLKGVLKELAFNIGGYKLHSLFWKNLSSPAGKKDNLPIGGLKEILNSEFGSFERFKKEFEETAMSAEGSGWAALVYDDELQKPMIAQIEKHNVNMFIGAKIVLLLDMFEHGYYIDYKSDKREYVNGFWNLVNWEEANKRLEIRN